MASRIPLITPRIGEFNIQPGTNNAYSQIGAAIGKIGALAQDLTDPIAQGILEAKGAEDRLAQFEAQKDLPVSELQKAKGINPLLAVTKWGSAYNESFNAIDSQLLEYSATKALQQSAMQVSSPENIGPGATIAFDQQAEEIIRGYSSVASGDKAKLAVGLLSKAGALELDIAGKEQAYNYQQTISSIKEVFDAKEAELKDAQWSGDTAAIAGLTREMKELTSNAVNLNMLTRAEGESALKEIDSQNTVGMIVGKYRQAQAKGNEAEFLASLVTAPEGLNLTVGEANKAAKSILEIQEFEDRVKSDHHALEAAHAEADIASGILTDKTKLVDYDLTNLQMLKFETLIDKTNATGASNAFKLKQARTDIIGGQSGGIDKSVVSAMTDQAWMSTQAEIGRPLTLMEKAGSIVGGPQAYPASGMPGVSLGTNDPTFDRNVSAALTSTDPQAMFQGYQVYEYMVITKGQPNTLNLSDDALRAAVSMKSLIEGGVSPDIAAKQTTTAVLNRNETGIAERLSDFGSKRNQDKLPSAFKSALGANPDINTQIYGDFINQVRVNYANGLEFDDAVEATAFNMRGYKESKYFLPGRVGQLAPEESLNMLAFEVDNQLAATLQNQINNGLSGAGGVPVTWANPEDAIDLAMLNPEDLVDMPLPAVNGGEKLLGDGFKTKLPEIMVGNHKSKVYLISGQRVRFGDNGRPLYELGYVDSIGQLQPLSDGRGPNSAATFSPVDISVFAPGYLTKFSEGERKKLIKEAAEKPLSEASDNVLNGLLRQVIATPGSKKSLDNLIDLSKNYSGLKEIEGAVESREKSITEALNRGGTE